MATALLNSFPTETVMFEGTTPPDTRSIASVEFIMVVTVMGPEPLPLEVVVKFNWKSSHSTLINFPDPPDVVWRWALAVN